MRLRPILKILCRRPQSFLARCEVFRNRRAYSGCAHNSLPDGEVALPLLPKRALTLAQELLTRGVQAIKADSWDVMYEQGAPQWAPDLRAATGG